MSRINDQLLAVALSKLASGKSITVNEVEPEDIEFCVLIDGRCTVVSIPEHELQSCTLEYVAETYLKPLLDDHRA